MVGEVALRRCEVNPGVVADGKGHQPLVADELRRVVCVH